MQEIVGNKSCPVLFREIPFILNIIATSFAGCSYNNRHHLANASCDASHRSGTNSRVSPGCMIIALDYMEANTMKTGSMLAIVLFSLVAVAHLVRLVAGIDVTVGEWGVPQWISVFGVIVPGLVAYLLWKESN